jgi:hypothetical protein
MYISIHIILFDKNHKINIYEHLTKLFTGTSTHDTTAPKLMPKTVHETGKL